MGLRWMVGVFLIQLIFWNEAASYRIRRQVSISNHHPEHPHKQFEPRAYQPPISPGAPSVPVASSATIQNSYQPPISLIRSNEYHSPINNHPAQYNGGQGQVAQGFPGQQQSSSQTYILPKQHSSSSYSVHQQPSSNTQHSYSIYQQPSPSSQNSQAIPPATSLATSYSVHQQPAEVQNNPRQSYPIFSDTSGLPQSTVERTYSSHSKAVGSSHVPAQAIHKAPASEIQSDKGSHAKDKDNKPDEYVVYYYYYYDNDTSPNNNLSLSFDDIPSLEAYDEKNGKEPDRSASARTLAANLNSLATGTSEPKRDGGQTSGSNSSQPRSVANNNRETVIRADRPGADTIIQPLKPVSNVFRYGSNEVPRFPVLPNFIITEVPTTLKPGDGFTLDTLSSESPTTQTTPSSLALPDRHNDSDNDDLNSVLDNATDLKSSEDKSEEEAETTTTTTTEDPTTTEIPATTTTERSRRRPAISGGRRRFNNNPSFTSTRNRQTPTRGSTSSTSTTTTTSPPTRGSFRGSSRNRPRPSLGNNRPRTGSRTTESNDDKTSVQEQETTTSTPSSRTRFSSSAAPRRFQSSRSRSQSSSTTSTTRSPSVSSRSRPTSRPRPNLITRNRPPRPGFLRPRPGSEPEAPETTTATPEPTEEETSPSGSNDESSSTEDNETETEEEDETSEEETEEPTTTEGNRFSALFRPRNRNALGNRPRPVISNRPARS